MLNVSHTYRRSANNALGFSDVSLNLTGVADNANEVFELILKTCEQDNRRTKTYAGSAVPVRDLFSGIWFQKQ